MHYQGLEMRLIIHKFTVTSRERVILPNKRPLNLYRDDFCNVAIQNFLSAQQQAHIQKAIAGMPAAQKVSDSILAGSSDSKIKVKAGAADSSAST